jgi:acetyl-CoA carboxylase biotin carboxyl carrier protein
VDLFAALPRSPEHVRIRTRDIELELDWATATSAPAAVSAPGESAANEPAANEVRPLAAGDRQAPPGRVVTAPTVGTFYLCPEPGSDPFVQVGDQVKPGQQVAIVEAMKLMLPVEADADAVITEVLVEDGQPVEYGQALFALDPRI